MAERPLDSGRKDVLGRTVRVSGDMVEGRATAPPPPAPVGLTDEDRRDLDELFDRQPALLEERQYVIVVRDPDSANDFEVFGNGVGRVETIDVDLGADDLTSGSEAYEWVMGQMTTAAGVTDRAARERLFDYAADVVDELRDDDPFKDRALAVVEYAGSKPLRAAPVSFDAAVSNAVEAAGRFGEVLPDGFRLSGVDNEAPVGLDPIQMSLSSDRFGSVSVSFDGDSEFMVYVHESGDDFDEGEYELDDIFGDDTNRVHAALRDFHSTMSGVAHRYGKHGLERFEAAQKGL